jgi:hypothetical protein
VGVIVVYRNVAQRPRQLRGFPSAAVGVVSRIGVVKCDEAVYGIRYGLVVRFLRPVYARVLVGAIAANYILENKWDCILIEIIAGLQSRAVLEGD